MSTRGLVAVAVALAGLTGAGLAAQGQVFRSNADIVSLNVTVTDKDGHFVGGLPKDAFEVYEDGVQQDVSIFSAEQEPVALSVLIDSSESMEEKLGVVQQAAVGFVDRLRPNDLAEIIDFNSIANILQEFSGDHAALEHAILKTRASGSTSLYNAIYVALNSLKSVRMMGDQIRRQAIVVLSDGEDTSSLVPYEEVLESAKRSEVLIYSVGLRSKDDVPTKGFNEADFVLRTLAQQTGGRAFFVQSVQELSAVYQQIADELASQYSIGYQSKNPKRDGAWRTIVVRVDRPGMAARHKRGYYGPTAR